MGVGFGRGDLVASASWNDDEDAALQGLRPATQVIYLRALRRYMDFATGVVGVVRKICYRGLAEAASFLPDVGSRSGGDLMTKSAVRAAIAELMRAGLVSDIPRYQSLRMLVFRLPLATWDQSVKNLNDTGTTQGKRHTDQHDEQHVINGSDQHTESEQLEGLRGNGATQLIGPRATQVAAQGTTQERHTMSDTHPLSVKYKNIGQPVDNFFVDNFSAGLAVLISEDFSPAESTKARCVAARCPPVTGDQIGLFLAHHQKTGSAYVDWQAAFYGWMLRAKQFSVGVTGGRSGSASHCEAWELVPEDDDLLVPWAVEHGFPAPKLGERYFEHRRRLQQCVQSRRRDRKKRSEISGGDCG